LFILFHLSFVRLAQANDVHLASAGCEHHGVELVTDKSKYTLPLLVVILAIINFDHRARPI